MITTRIIAIAAVGVALTGSDASAIGCRSEKGAGYPWSWRQIDGKQCWYKGEPGMDKAKLRWPPTTTGRKTNDNDDLLHTIWPPIERR